MGLAKQAGNCAVRIRGCLRTFITSRWVKGLRRISSKTVIVVSTKVRRKEFWRRLKIALDYLPLVQSILTLHTKESSQLALYYRSVNTGMTFHFLEFSLQVVIIIRIRQTLFEACLYLQDVGFLSTGTQFLHPSCSMKDTREVYDVFITVPNTATYLPDHWHKEY